jgi:hypothetical protein
MQVTSLFQSLLIYSIFYYFLIYGKTSFSLYECDTKSEANATPEKRCGGHKRDAGNKFISITIDI